MKKIFFTILIVIQAFIGFQANAYVELYTYSLFSDANLQAYWRFEGNSNDATAHGNNGTDTSMSYSTSPTVFGQAAQFNGTAGRITINDSTTMPLTASATFIMWLNNYDPGTSTAERIIGQWSGTGNQYAWFLNKDAGGADHYKLVFADTSGCTTGTLKQTITTNQVLATSTWAQVAVVKNGTAVTFYKDGQAIPDDGVATNATPCNGTLATTIGANVDGGTPNQWFRGAMDDIAYFNRSLSATEILNFYNASPAPSGKRRMIFIK